MSQAILNAIKARLVATSSLTAIVGTRIYLDVGVANAALPLLVYRATDTRTEPMINAVKHTMQLEFQFFFANSGTQDIHTSAQALATAFSTSLAVTGFDRAVLVRSASGVPSFSDDSWSMTETYRLTAFDI
jgi:hypothetical protein